MVVLVIVTGIYAWRTFAIGKATERQTEEVREQRLSEAQPYLLIRLKDEFIQWEEIENKPPRKEFGAEIRNEGKGPAINLSAYLWHPNKLHPYGSKGYLAPSEQWDTTISRLNIGLGMMKTNQGLSKLVDLDKYNGPGIIAVEYNDVHKRTWVSYLFLERHIDVEHFVIEGDQDIKEFPK